MRRPTGHRVVLAVGSLVCALALAAVATEAGAGAWIEERTGAAPTLSGARQADMRTATDVTLPVGHTVVPGAVTGGAVPDAAKLAATIGAVPLDGLQGGRFGIVVDPASGRVLYDQGAGQTVLPASSLKLLTVTAALDLLGPDHVFTTRAVVTDPGTVVLVGGGDPYLSSGSVATAHPERASLEVLADRTAAALKSGGSTSVSLRWDASLFGPPQWHPDWPTLYADQVTPVTALVVNEGRLSGVSPGPRTQNPSAEAAKAFAQALTARGITVKDQSALTGSVPSGAGELGRVESMPLSSIVESLLNTSDNDAAEMVARQVGIAAGTGATFQGATTAVEQVLRRRGLWDSGAVLRDGSGLSRNNRVTPRMLAGAVALATGDADTRFRPLLEGLPVAGATGTLTARFGRSGSEAGRGLVRAKTGTLSGTSALAGYAVTTSGGSSCTRSW
ncbi:D-alanyl-D-alanine carboxypeptidase/D-alanyl-D-alanine endopeptidase [Raineyella fluvialis]|uniref:D-alanyl-D-alanine carboxypeptidase/D-alanyl-D-alanine-endopeptidase n=1 Tax=Raineyella fluvialis TaxID=2662261 RepID=A0A5Q2FHU2_9ACTN|nr:D-alanyl-D-alanine carboxypeptidase/D-alanyl-D-alanine-endopeptidase [Raineyella fluvialis]QGF23926.1 D-alanyl-D-alanine carboxypeptidase/D-alanyl-D-alanine-endopeptidase [Raineyella fluvialis]